MKVLKWIGRIVFLGILVCIFLVLYFLDDVVKSKIISGVSEASDGHYKIEIKSLDAKFWTGAIRMDEVWLIPDHGLVNHKNPHDSTVSVPNVKFHLDTVTVSEIDWIRYLLDNQELKIGDVWIFNPRLIVKGKIKNNSNINQSNNDFLEFLPGIIAAFTGSLHIQSIKVQKGSMDVVLLTPSGLSYRQTSNVDLNLENIRIDTSSTKKALFTETAVFDLRNYKFFSSDGLYDVSIKKIHGQVNDSLLKVYDFRLRKKDTVGNRFRDEFYVKISEAENKGVNFTGLFRQKKIGFRKMKIKGAYVDLLSSGLVSNKIKKESNDSVSILNNIAPYISNSFDLDTFLVEKSSVLYKIKNLDKDIRHSAENISLFFTRVKVDSSIKKQKLLVEDIQLSLNNYRFANDQSIDLRLSFLKASVSDSLLDLKGLVFNSQGLNSVNARANQVRGKGVDYLNIFEDNKASFNNFSIINPEVKTISRNTHTKKTHDKPEIFFKNILGPLAGLSLQAKKFVIANGKFDSEIISKKSNLSQHVEKLNLLVYGLKVDSTSLAQFKAYDHFRLEMDQYMIKLGKSNFKINSEKVIADSKSSNLFLNKISISQIYSLGPHQKTYFRNNISYANAKNFDFDRFFKSQEVHINDLTVQNMDLKIFYDETKTSPPDSGTSPQSIIKKIPFFIKVDSARINSSRILYEEKNPNYKNLARLSLDNFFIKVRNFTNDQASVSKNNPVYLRGLTYINNTGLLNFTINLPSMTKRFDASISGVVDSMSGNSFNDFFSFYDMKVVSGQINKGTFDMDIQNSSMAGDLKFEYDNLKISVNKKGGSKRNKFKSLLGNIIIKDSNPVKEGEAPEVVHLCGKKSPDDSLLNFVWTHISDGIITTVTKKSLYSPFVKR